MDKREALEALLKLERRARRIADPECVILAKLVVDLTRLLMDQQEDTQ
jgi:hypothetical protein